MTDEEVFGTAATPPQKSMLRSAAEAVGWPKPLPEGAPIPTLEERLATDRGGESPNSWSNLADRAVTTIAAAPVDLPIALMNVGARAAGNPEIPYVAPQMRAMAGAQEMPNDAPWYQRGAEGVATALLSGGRGVVPMARSAAVGTGGWLGGEGGARIGEALGVDPETMAILGGALGGMAPRAVGNVSRSAVANLYGAGKGREPLPGMPGAGEIYDTAQRSGVTPTMDLVGNQATRDQWAALRSQPGSQNTIREAGRTTRRQLTQSAQEVPDDAGATMRRDVDIGEAAQNTADAALTALENRNSARQEAMQQRVGDPTIDVSSLEREMARLIDPSRSNLATTQSDPIRGKLNELRALYPEPQGPVLPNQPPLQPIPELRYGQLKNYRNEFLNAAEGFKPVTGREANDLKSLQRQMMQDTAAARGVPPGEFNSVQAGSTRLPGQTERLEPLTPRATTDYGTVYNRLLEGGEQNPALLRDFRRDVNNAVGVGTGNPQVNNIYASHLNNLIDSVLNYRGGSALGPTNMAARLRSMADDSLRQLSGSPLGYQRMRDIETLGRALHRPTETGGGQAAAANVAGASAADLARPLAGAAGALMGGADPTGVAAASLFAKSLGRPIDYARGSLLNSPSAVAGAAGRPTPYLPGVNVNDIRSALMALQGSQLTNPPK